MVVYITDPIPIHGIFWAQWRYLSWHWPSLPCLMVYCHPSNKSALNRKYFCLSIWLFIYVDWHPGKHPWLDRTFIKSLYILFSIYNYVCVYIYTPLRYIYVYIYTPLDHITTTQVTRSATSRRRVPSCCRLPQIRRHLVRATRCGCLWRVRRSCRSRGKVTGLLGRFGEDLWRPDELGDFEDFDGRVDFFSINLI